MMGNLSPVSGHCQTIEALIQSSRLATSVTLSFQNLKSHAVTMFEVGKLSDETLDSFLAELEKVRPAVETEDGDARVPRQHQRIIVWKII